MRLFAAWLLAVALGGAVLAGCQCGSPLPSGPELDGGEGPTTEEDAGDGGDGGAGTDGGPPVQVDPHDPANPNKDSDCDGLSDAEEFSIVHAGGKRTDPANPDSDGDGIPDGVESGRTSSPDLRCTQFVGDADPATTTLPTEADTDADGLPDGLEDANRNGKVDAQETDPLNPDSDGDGLKDGAEDANQNGAVDADETDPRKKDSDGDLINDGIERMVTLTDPVKADTDGDTCPDGLEDFNQNGIVDVGETNPKLATDCGPATILDSDNDGLPDKIEDSNSNGMVDPGETDPNNPDTDGDGLLDGVEDKNKNGRVDLGETDPRRLDSDCDGLIDGPDTATFKGEDQNANGMVDANETDPTNPDTDGDGLRDGLERGVIVNPDSQCTDFTPDADPATTTDPTKRDSDNDGIDDGAEDANQNGALDPGELNPNDPGDATGPAGQACSASNLRPVTFRAEGGPDLRLGLPATFTELAAMTVNGSTKGLIGYDPTHQVAFLAWRQAAPNGAITPTADEAALRTVVDGLGALSNITTQTFTTWDSVPALQAFYEQAGSADLKTRTNDLANALVGASAGALSGLAGVAGPFQLQAEYAHRSDQSLVVVLALTPKSLYVEPGIFSVNDVGGGSALAQFGDANAVQCETFKPGNSKVDFLFVVDDSCSMGASQTALADAATAMETSLNNSSLDWRIGMVTTAYYLGTTSNNNNTVRPFTRNINQFKAWLTQNSTCSSGNCTLVPQPASCPGGSGNGSNGGCWVGTGGSGNERLLQSARRAVNTITPATVAEQDTSLRDGAKLVVILLGDADDQSTVAVSEFTAFFNNTGSTLGTDQNPANQTIPVHGVICPVGTTCNGEPNNDRHGQVIAATGGVRGAINNATSISTSIAAIVNSAIAAAGHQMLKPPIGASVKVALDDVLDPMACNKNDLPRSRQDGFDFDGVNRTISFFGDCRPPTGTVNAAVSYRYWIDITPNPNGNPPPCVNDPDYDASESDFCKGRLACNLTTDTCECPSNCGGNAPPGKVCNPNKLVCDFVCTADCGGTCHGYQMCNTSNCSCECAPNATCAPGYKFESSNGVCGCVCDTAALNCDPTTYDADPTVCACVCKPDCGGTCQGNQTCNTSTCACGGGIN